MTLHRPAFIALFIALVMSFAAVAASPAVAKSRAVHAVAGVAISGYDPVAYFHEGRAMRGSGSYALRWRGAVWHFASAANLAAFEADPMAFFPQFGGYCVDALARGEARPGDPEIWVIHDGRLYLSTTGAARDRWRAETPEILERAASHWPDILKD